MQPTNAAIRDENGANDHQNITYDHCITQYTLFDGYFLTGMGEEDITTIPSDLEPVKNLDHSEIHKVRIYTEFKPEKTENGN